jgi:hypothetical protein
MISRPSLSPLSISILSDHQCGKSHHVDPCSGRGFESKESGKKQRERKRERRIESSWNVPRFQATMLSQRIGKKDQFRALNSRLKEAPANNSTTPERTTHLVLAGRARTAVDERGARAAGGALDVVRRRRSRRRPSTDVQGRGTAPRWAECPRQPPRADEQRVEGARRRHREARKARGRSTGVDGVFHFLRFRRPSLACASGRKSAGPE